MMCPLASQPWELPMRLVDEGGPLAALICRHCGFRLSGLDLIFLKGARTMDFKAARDRQYARAAEEASGVKTL